ncbi:hypothetical protein ACH5RR_009544 [Cinchona calisaya]|uniref:FAD/NAD(P)-binding domain-containing protein n=1 Tax=Cinchona calisaya TaxID=153742 RepID=A0ABD3AHQ3_9GENT
MTTWSSPPGHDDPLPKFGNERICRVSSRQRKDKNCSHSIVVVGGGPTGVELAAEIAVDFPEKKVTLVHEGPRLLEFIEPKAANKTLDWLKKKNVQVKLQQSIDMDRNCSDGCNVYITSSHETTKADCHFLCTGKPLGSGWLNETILKNNMDNFGRLKVDDNLRIKGHKNIFAIGNITDIKSSFCLPPVQYVDNSCKHRTQNTSFDYRTLWVYYSMLDNLTGAYAEN